MRAWQFSKPKGPGYGIARGFYLSALCTRSVLPPIAEIVNPTGQGGAIEGFGVPLTASTDKSLLAQPLSRGAYAIASKDRKTVLRTLVMSPDEAGYDPEAFAKSAVANASPPELVASIRATWTLVQLSFESFDPEVYPALDLLLATAVRIGILAEAVIADPISQRFLFPHQVFALPRIAHQVDAREHIGVHSRTTAQGLAAFTLGMQKFALPEYEIPGLDRADLPDATTFLFAIAQKVLMGDLTRSGDRFGAPKLALEAREGGHDRRAWEGIPVFDLLPPTGRTSGECVRAWP